MKTIQKDNFVCRVDVEKTKDYYQVNSLCDCDGCRNLRAQIQTARPKLATFLSEFGIDINRPDEMADIEAEDALTYTFVGYTAVGQIETDGMYETEIDGLHIEISKGDTPYNWFPNEQKEPCFFITVKGLSLPWVLDEPFPHSERCIDKIKRFFKKTNT